MEIALCYESVLPARGGCETYIGDLARRLVADGHTVHLYACRWEAASLPSEMRFHQLPAAVGPRFLRPWLFGRACLHALRSAPWQTSIGFDKTWGQDVLYPQGGLHQASAHYNLRKYRDPFTRALARLCKSIDLAHWSFRLLERKQYRRQPRPLIVVNSDMVARHFKLYHDIDARELRVVHSAIDPSRFVEYDRPRRRLEWRERWGIEPEDIAGLFVAMNYRLKGLEPLLNAVRLLPRGKRFHLLIAGSPRTESYERLARRLGIAERVRFIGQRRDIHNCYFAADFLVHPTFYDPCSLVVLEALACGLPVITTRYNGASELVHPPSEGYVVENPHDHYELAEAIEQLLDPATRSACAHAARRAAADWTFEHHYQQLLHVMAEAESRKRAA
jgi:UDP-glucose:(heptosyl)LPS alpha-1,3-glucosyltransferase